MAEDFQDRYEIISRIGAGGVGAVYKAKDTRLGRMVAVKRLLPPDESEDQAKLGSDLIKEARALSAFQHPNIITVFDYGEDEDGLYIIMELLEGETVEELAQNSQLHVDTLTELAEQCLEGLSVAHSRNLLHRDLKPSNLFVTQVTGGEAKVKILDFGLAKFSATPALQTVDQSRSILGSIYFMAPEQFLRQPLDARCDLYQLGCVFFYALTSEYAFDGETTAAVMDAHLDHTPKDLATLRPDVAEELRDWVTSLISRDPEDRPKTAAKALQQLRIIAQKHGFPAAPPLADEPVTQQVSAITETARTSLSATEVYLQNQKDLAEKKSVAKKQISTPIWIGGIGVLTLAFVAIIGFALSEGGSEAAEASVPEKTASEKPTVETPVPEVFVPNAPIPVRPATSQNSPPVTQNSPPVTPLVPIRELLADTALEIDLDALKGVIVSTGGYSNVHAKVGDRIATWIDQSPFGGESRPSFFGNGDEAMLGYQPTYSNTSLISGKPPRPSIRFSGREVLRLESKINRGTDLSEIATKLGSASFFVLASTNDDSQKRRAVLNWAGGDSQTPLYGLYTTGSEIGFTFETWGVISKTTSISLPKTASPVLFELGIARDRQSIRITNWSSKGEIINEVQSRFPKPVHLGAIMKIGGFQHKHRNATSSLDVFHDFIGDIFSLRVISGADATYAQRKEQVQAMWKIQP